MKSQRKTILVQLAIYDADGSGNDSIDFAFSDMDGNQIDAIHVAPLVYQAVESLKQEFGRSWDTEILSSPIVQSNEKYQWIPQAKPQLLSNTQYDIATKLKAAVPYYFSGIIEQDHTQKSTFCHIAMFVPKYTTMDDVVIEVGQKRISGQITGCSGGGDYIVRTPDGDFSIQENQL